MPEARSAVPATDLRDGRSRPWVTSPDVVDLFVYVVILNLATQYVPSVIVESFSLSLLTALVLKFVLELVLAVTKRAAGRMKAATTAIGKVAGAVLLWVVAVGSKFLVLILEDLVFGDRVSLGNFLSVTALIISLLLSRAGVRWLLAWRPPPGSRPPNPVSGDRIPV